MLAKDVEKKEHSFIVGIASWYNPLEISLMVPQKFDIVLPEDPAIPLLGIYPNDVPTYNKDTCSTMLIVALFIIARSSKDPRYPSTEE